MNLEYSLFFMYLCIASTQRGEHHLFLFGVDFVKEYSDNCFTLLEAIDNFFKKEEIQKESIKGIAVVVGVGTFSSVRIATTLANAWHFANSTPVKAIALEDVSELQLIAKEMNQDSAYILPTYSGEPNIGKKKE